MHLLSLFILAWTLFSPSIGANETNSPKKTLLTPITLQLLWKHQFEFAGYYAAKEKGFYSDVGLDVSLRELNDNEDPTEEVISGRAQYGIGDATLIIDRSRGKPVVLLSNIFQHSPLVLITKSESGITSPAHMIGKKIMLSSNELSSASIVAMLSKESVTIDQIQVIPHNFKVDDLINNKVDIISAYATNQPSIFKNKGIPINIISPINYGIDFYGDNIFSSEEEVKNHPERVRNFIEASLKGWAYALNNPNEIIELILKQYSQKKSRNELQFEAKTLKKFILPEFVPLGTIDDSRLQHTIKTYIKLNLLNSSFTLEGFLYQQYLNNQQNTSLFTANELSWIKQKKQLTIGIDPSWPPFEFIDDNQVYSGMSADIIELISKKTGLAIKVQKNAAWADVIASAKNKTLDLLPAVVSSPQRNKFLDFSTIHTSYPMVIVTTKSSPFISQLSDLNHKKVVVVKGHVTEDIIRNNHPLIELITAKNIDDALTIIANDEATAFVDNLATIITAISAGGFNNLRISGTTPYQFDLRFGVIKGEKTLLNILQKALNNISKEQRSAIKDKWISLQYTQSVDYTKVYQIIILSTLILIIFFFWNRRLAKEIHFRKAAEKLALNSERRFRMLFEDNQAIELIIDPETGSIIEANRAAVDFYGFSKQELKTKLISQINILSPQEVAAEMNMAKIEMRTHFYFKHRLANGDIRDVEVHSGPVEWDERTLLYSIIHDVTNEKKLQAELAVKATELEYHASHDTLTKLLNRREFEHRLYKAIKSCQEDKFCKRTVLALDLDNFKVVNDTAGHAVGDDVLYKISQIMSAKVRARDTFARLGGDEFGVLLENCTLSDAEEVASSIIEAVKNFQYQWHDSTFHLGVSIGISAIECDDQATMDETLNKADAACYEAKSKGRNRFQIFSDKNIELSRRKGERWWTNEIVSAIDENRFCLYHQIIAPISSQNQHEGKQYEVLLRLRDVEGKLIFPDSFIPAAERYHLMPTVDLWVIKHVFKHIASDKKSSAKLFKCAINLSGHSVASDGFYEAIMQLFKQHAVSPNKICWEITETAAIADFDKAKTFISNMRQFGCSFSLDDFGSGLSSFNYLKHLEVDYIKIDGSFVKEILSDPKDELIVESIQNISQGLGMRTIAEFVENDDIKQKLIAMGIDYAQGYGIHKPSPLE